MTETQLTETQIEPSAASLQESFHWPDPEDVKPQRGDMIKFNRTLYTHWGVYVGEGEVVHLGPPDEPFWDLFLDLADDLGIDNGVVRRDNIETVADGCKYAVDNYLVTILKY